MKKLKVIKLLLLSTAVITGCGAPPSTKEIETPPSAAALTSVKPIESCAERSAAALPPKHPVVELAWCIAEADDLYDPNKLFRKTLKIDNYKIVKQDIGIRAFNLEDSQQFKYLVNGVVGFEYTRTLPEKVDRPGNSYLSFNVDSQKVCVKMSDVEATFGKDYWFSAVPIVVPSAISSEASLSSKNSSPNPYGIFFKSPKIFMANPNSSVNFYFENKKCLVYISLQNRLDFVVYKSHQKVEK